MAEDGWQEAARQKPGGAAGKRRGCGNELGTHAATRSKVKPIGSLAVNASSSVGSVIFTSKAVLWCRVQQRTLGRRPRAAARRHRAGRQRGARLS